MDGIVSALQSGLGFFYYILVYGIGLLAMSLSVFSYQLRRRESIILCACVGQLAWIAHFFLQGDLASAIACALSAVMLAIFSKKDTWKWACAPATVVFFIVVLSGFSLLSFADWRDIFPLLAGVFAVLSNCQSSEKRLRRLGILWCLFWFCNSLTKGYPIALVTDFCSTLSAVISLYRYREKGNTTKQNEVTDNGNL